MKSTTQSLSLFFFSVVLYTVYILKFRKYYIYDLKYSLFQMLPVICGVSLLMSWVPAIMWTVGPLCQLTSHLLKHLWESPLHCLFRLRQVGEIHNMPFALIFILYLKLL